MSENEPTTLWPPICKQAESLTALQSLSLISSTTPAWLSQPLQNMASSSPIQHNSTSTRHSPLASATNKLKKHYRNSFETKPQTWPNTTTRIHIQWQRVTHMCQANVRWNKLAVEAWILLDRCALWDFQMQCSNALSDVNRVWRSQNEKWLRNWVCISHSSSWCIKSMSSCRNGMLVDKSL